MSEKHPIIAVTGSAGAGTTTVRHAFANLFRREGIDAAFVEGEGFMHYPPHETLRKIKEAEKKGKIISEFGPDLNQFDRLEALFSQYAKHGAGEIRRLVRDATEAKKYGCKVGDFTPWEALPKHSDLLVYEGTHGGVAASTWTRRRSSPAHFPPEQDRRGKGGGSGRGVDAAQWVDLLVGVVPSVNLEWIQRIHSDCGKNGCTPEMAVNTILRRMSDYVHFIVPQFTITDINFQRIPLVDTSNPFIARDVPTADESMVVIHFRDPKKYNFPALLQKLHGSFMSRPNTMVVPGGKIEFALEVVCGPIIHDMMEQKKKLSKRA